MSKELREYNFPADLKEMNIEELDLLTYSIRDFLIENVSKTGGHIASNLGVVELSIAIHKFFNSPHDKIIWDVGHQSYVHKILTGRADKFDTLRKLNGLSGFPKGNESEHDAFDTGHSSTSISVAAGIAAARDIKGESFDVVSVIGDGSLTGGLAYEALNNVGASKSKVIVILNDNGMSISKNIGSMSQHLGNLRTSREYINAKKHVKNTLDRIPIVGTSLASNLGSAKDRIKYALISGGVIFEELGFTYFGPIDGHNIKALLDAFALAKQAEGPVLIHVLTKKGKGYKTAEINPGKFHGIAPFDPETGELLSKSGKTYSKVFGEKLYSIARTDERVVAITAAMGEATGLGEFSRKYKERFFDVGIAEAHGVTFAAGLAKTGLRPVVAIYSSFLQRAYDQILEDVCMQNLPVIFAIDRAGIVGADGETHHGLFDLSYLGSFPNMRILAPSNGNELEAMFDFAMSLNEPVAIRYPRGECPYEAGSYEKYEGKNSRIYEGKDLDIWAVGNMLETGKETVKILREKGINAGLVSVSCVKPLDLSLLLENRFVVTLEDNVLLGGFGEKMKASLEGRNVLSFGWPDKFIEQGSCNELYEKYGLDAASITERICEYIEEKA